MRIPKLLLAAVTAYSLALFQAAAASLQTPKGMDVFGAAPGSVAELERCFGTAARELVAAYDASDRARALELEEKLERQIKEAGVFESVDITVVQYFEPGQPSVLTFNLKLAGSGPPLQYLPEPKEDVPDPEGLLASWWEYQKIGSALEIADQLGPSPSCPAYHCLFGFDHPKLRPYGDLFARKVLARRVELVEVLLKDRDTRDRAAAAYLLAHLPNAAQVLEALLPQLRDPAPSPRNSILRVLGAMVEKGTAPSIPIEPILPFLSSSVLTDRNKAAAIVAALASDKRHRTLLLHRAGCDLVRLLETKQPNQTEWAHSALVKLRGSDLAASDPAAWRDWLKSQGVTCQPDPEIDPGKLCPISPPATKNQQ
jgi:hypothetical protein